MAERRPSQPPDDIELVLRDLGRQLDWPAEPDLLPGVRERLASAPRRGPFVSRLRPSTKAVRLGWATAALVVIVALVLSVSDSTRSTVADRLGLPGVSISADPTATLSPGGELSIGEIATLDDAALRSGDGLILPPEAVLGAPDAIYVLDQDGTVQVSYVYLPRPNLPEVGGTGVGLLISQFDGSTNSSFIQKQLGPETTIELVEVGQQSGFWLTGGPHLFVYERPDGAIREETIRLAANVLLWEQDGKTLRIETTLDRNAAIRIAEAMDAGR
ncbi:MAG: hypothetical protein WEC79_02000 [Thermomicrobiales bacterium]